ncbi:transmembrane cell adhesion receptor mua-3-like isoform X5 [Scyliorhinus canicula]|uniref:transmembrane cell adhesion receptor mua-3-like isoform X5 n=1 Tax=Scyliorhinus canicula TaxID=7830 RepID=UPI0018F44403|nr:transmembrane cell adhesion receptor mua-3-like isoform X5 [Scyliorhinus canicula]
MNHSQPCQDEEDCGKWMQCCETSCGRRCVHSFMGQQHSPKFSDLTAGHCPAPHRLSTMCELRYGELCEDDDDCYAWQTCCNTTCGRRCVHVFHGKGGDRRCPESSRLTHICTMSFNTQCHNDSDCDGWQTCCNSSCGNRCVPKFLTGSTQCPASSRLDNFCELKLGDVCESDADCLAWSSCCDAECGKRCVPRFFMSRDDTCPAPHRLTPMCDLKLGDQCSGDDDCDAWQTCCDTKCGKVCITSFMDDDEGDECPDSYRARRICASNSSESCNDDEDCSSWKQCCDIGCGKKCVYSRWHKESDQCPSSSSLSKVCSLKLGDECEEDADCDHWQMCCDAGCGKRCVFKFFKGENGSCPAPSRLRPMCDVNYGKDCEDNDDCDLWLTCCDAGCGKRCVHRAFRDAGKSNRECPELSTTQHICDKGEAEKCERDEDCTGWKKCCQVGDCGKRCVYTFHKKVKRNRECPELSTTQHICDKGEAEKCERDEDCTGWKKCCQVGDCGKRCVYTFHKKVKRNRECPELSTTQHICDKGEAEKCERDENCTGWKKCCQVGDCGKRCVYTFHKKEDFYEECPEPSKTQHVCDKKNAQTCEEDDECRGWKQCCRVGDCGKRCIDVFHELDFYEECPEPSKTQHVCDKKNAQTCEEDDECRGWKQCCRVGDCGKRCIDVFHELEFYEECPEPSETQHVCDKKNAQTCEEDDECWGWKQCCRVGDCGKRCIDVFHELEDFYEECPEPSKTQHVCDKKNAQTCEEDDECRGWKQCCRVGDCGKRCIDVFHELEYFYEECPEPSKTQHVCDKKNAQTCEEDDECRGWKQCCRVGDCGKRCIDVFHELEFYEECPEPSETQHVCDKKNAQTCEEDDECWGWKQCCRVGDCGKRCIDVFHELEFYEECPEPSKTQHVCDKKNAQTCEEDDECRGWKQCCRVGDCGKRCIDVFYELEEFYEECPEPSETQHVCDKKNAQTCEEDDECRGWKQCCRVGDCGKRCIDVFYELEFYEECPEPSETQHVCDKKNAQTCEEDDECRGWKQCCRVGDCGKRCIDVFHELESCKSNDDCARYLTCCRGHCRMWCSQPGHQHSPNEDYEQSNRKASETEKDDGNGDNDMGEEENEDDEEEQDDYDVYEDGGDACFK